MITAIATAYLLLSAAIYATTRDAWFSAGWLPILLHTALTL